MLINSKFNPKLDTTLPVSQREGIMHPIRETIQKISKIMEMQNFVKIDGNSIEDEFYNFTALNIPPNHPARANHDTFRLVGSDKILRSHGTCVDIRVLESKIFEPPFAVFTIGPSYRRDDDPTHLPMFNQIDGLMVGKNITIAHLMGHMKFLIESYFDPLKPEIRFRTSHFSFTEPSVEVDMRLPGGEWLEVIGAGMIRSNILSRFGYEDCTGFAFGAGVERFAMIKYNVSNMSLFYQNRYDFLEHFRPKKSYAEMGQQ